MLNITSKCLDHWPGFRVRCHGKSNLCTAAESWS